MHSQSESYLAKLKQMYSIESPTAFAISLLLQQGKLTYYSISSTKNVVYNEIFSIQV